LSFSPALPLVDGLIPLILFSVSKFEGKEKDHILFRGEATITWVWFKFCGWGWLYSGVVDGTSQDGQK